MGAAPAESSRSTSGSPRWRSNANSSELICHGRAIYDVALDLRRASPTFGKWIARELRAETGEMLYVPEGCAHGFMTLEPNTSTEYLIWEFYARAA
ncbi:MAG: dTDP-4-keto-6-deoxy-D-glucose epimerase [Chloroflexi bacterium]|nr:MAG: dTDP-4-keto-6-deoxy-D-glucose epimerase [Chloroflexota bacterium]